MGFDLTFNYVASRWTLHWWEDKKVCIHTEGKTLREVLDKLPPQIKTQVELWLYCR